MHDNSKTDSSSIGSQIAMDGPQVFKGTSWPLKMQGVCNAGKINVQPMRVNLCAITIQMTITTSGSRERPAREPVTRAPSKR